MFLLEDQTFHGVVKGREETKNDIEDKDKVNDVLVDDPKELIILKEGDSEGSGD